MLGAARVGGVLDRKALGGGAGPKTRCLGQERVTEGGRGDLKKSGGREERNAERDRTGVLGQKVCGAKWKAAELVVWSTFLRNLHWASGRGLKGWDSGSGDGVKDPLLLSSH